MRSVVCRARVCVVLGLLAGRLATASAQDGGGFEDLAEGAAEPGDLGLLAAPFAVAVAEECASDPHDAIDEARCRGVQRALRRQLPARRFRLVVDDPAAVMVSDYDARVRGVRLGIAGCLVCDQPIALGASGQRRLITLRPPERGGRTLAEATELTSAALGFDGVPETKAWLAEVRPHLRAELVFQADGQEWSQGPSRGIAFKLLGARVFHRCTGEVVHSVPPSRGPGPRARDRADCGPAPAGAAAAAPAAPPGQLAAADIARAMQEVRPAIDACLERVRLRGTASLRFVVAGQSGIPTSVTLEGTLEGTALGSCIREAARKARFPRFGADSQRFTYPVLLGR